MMFLEKYFSSEMASETSVSADVLSRLCGAVSLLSTDVCCALSAFNNILQDVRYLMYICWNVVHLMHQYIKRACKFFEVIIDCINIYVIP